MHTFVANIQTWSLKLERQQNSYSALQFKVFLLGTCSSDYCFWIFCLTFL